MLQSSNGLQLLLLQPWQQVLLLALYQWVLLLGLQVMMMQSLAQGHELLQRAWLGAHCRSSPLTWLRQQPQTIKLPLQRKVHPRWQLLGAVLKAQQRMREQQQRQLAQGRVVVAAAAAAGGCSRGPAAQQQLVLMVNKVMLLPATWTRDQQQW